MLKISIWVMVVNAILLFVLGGFLLYHKYIMFGSATIALGLLWGVFYLFCQKKFKKVNQRTEDREQKTE